jgi:signal peptidase II
MKLTKELINKLIIFFSILILGVVFDQVSKSLIVKYIPLGDSKTIIDNFFFFSHTKNTGAAFSILEGNILFLTIVSIVEVVFFGFLIFKKQIFGLLKKESKEIGLIPLISFSLIVSGGLGNLIDRIRLGYVVDFLHFYFGKLGDYAIFNVADSLVTIGAVILVVYFIFFDKKEVVKEESEEETNDITSEG